MVTPNDFRVLPQMGFGAKNLFKVTMSARLPTGRALQTEEILWGALGDSTETLQQQNLKAHPQNSMWDYAGKASGLSWAG